MVIVGGLGLLLGGLAGEELEADEAVGCELGDEVFPAMVGPVMVRVTRLLLNDPLIGVVLGF